MKHFFLTGRPRIGKTTVLLRTTDMAKALGLKVGGMLSHEVRENGSRIGFEILDIANGRKGCLAESGQYHGPYVGRYSVNLKDLDDVGANSILNAIKESDLIVIDEIGPMELFSEHFQDAVRNAIASNKLLIGSIHWKRRNIFSMEIRRSNESEIIEVTLENREHLHENLMRKILEQRDLHS